MTGSDSVVVNVDAPTAILTLNRPDRLNALDRPAVLALRAHLSEIADDRAIRAVVLTGAGRGFCAGGDVADFDPGAAASSPPTDLRRLMEICELLHNMAKVTVAAVNGPCAGAGLGFAAACDLRIAAASAVFATAFLNVGVSGDHGTIWSVTRAVGPSHARALFLLGDRFDAHEALRHGLVHEVVADNEVRSRALEMAATVARRSPSALRAMKENLNDAVDLPLSEYLDREVTRYLEVASGPHAAEAARSYLEKRPPVFDDG